MAQAVQDRLQKTKPQKKTDRFSSRIFRFYVQLISFALILWIGIEFYLFVRHVETGGQAAFVERPPGVEGFLPISALVSLRDWLHTGLLNAIHPSSVIIFLTVIAMAFFLKKGFCSWVCPVGFISEMVGNVGDKITRRRLKLPKLLDYPLRGVKYFLLGFFVYTIFFQMSATAIRAFVESPYNKVADIKMMKFFIDISPFAFYTIVALFVLSVFLRGFWCRYLCPYGALLGLISLIGPTRIRRDPISCIDCGKCAKACPSFIKVDEVKNVVSDECTGCLDCVDVCPIKGALELKAAGRNKAIPKKAWAWAAVILFWGTLTVFKLTGPWENSVSTEEYIHHVEQMEGPGYSHPGR
jgi:polyferredoxin